MERSIIQGITTGMIITGEAATGAGTAIMTEAKDMDMAGEGINILKPANQRALYMYQCMRPFCLIQRNYY